MASSCKDAFLPSQFANKKYLSTDLFREEPLRQGYLTPDITLVGVESLKRVC